MKVFRTDENLIKEYFESESLNQSKLKNISKGLQYFKDSLEKEFDSEAMKIGRAVDLKLSAGKEVFDNTYFVTDEKIPEGVIGEIVKLIYENIDSANPGTLSDHKTLIGAVLEEYDWYASRTLASRINSVIKGGEQYFDFLIKANGKEVVNSEFMSKVDKHIVNFKNNDLINTIISEDFEEDNNTLIFYQIPIYFILEDIECKALIDCVVVNLNSKNEVTNLTIIDFKTTSSYLTEFNSVAMSLRYDIQGTWYKTGILSDYTSPVKEFNDLSGKFTDCNVDLFFAVSSDKCDRAEVFYASDQYIEDSVRGYKNSRGYNITGLGEMISLYKFYEKTNWSEEYEFYGQHLIPLKHYKDE